MALWFLDDYDPASLVTIPIIRGRYRFDVQPSVALWNLQRLAQTLTPLWIDALKARRWIAAGRVVNALWAANAPS